MIDNYSAASSSHHELSRDSLLPNGHSSSEEPVLRAPKLEPPENPFISPLTPHHNRPMRQDSPPRLGMSDIFQHLRLNLLVHQN